MPLSRAKLELYERLTGERVSAELWARHLGEHRLTRRLSAGQHIAPYLGFDGGLVLLQLGKGGELIAETEISTQPGIVPEAHRLLPRGFHCAPWRIDGFPVHLAIDAAHRCVSRIPVATNDSGLVEIVRGLMLFLEVHEASEADKARERSAAPEVASGNWDDEDDDAGEEWKRGK